MRSAAVVCLLCALHTAQAFTARPLQATMVSRRRQHHCAGPPVPVMSMLNQPGSSADAHDDAHGEDGDVGGADADAELSPAMAPRAASDAGEGADGGDAEPQARHCLRGPLDTVYVVHWQSLLYKSYTTDTHRLAAPA